jgi:hypothetical protein
MYVVPPPQIGLVGQDGDIVVVVVVVVHESHGMRDGTIVVLVVVSVLKEVNNSLVVSVITLTEPVYIVEVAV